MMANEKIPWKDLKRPVVVVVWRYLWDLKNHIFSCNISKFFLTPKLIHVKLTRTKTLAVSKWLFVVGPAEQRNWKVFFFHQPSLNNLSKLETGPVSLCTKLYRYEQLRLFAIQLQHDFIFKFSSFFWRQKWHVAFCCKWLF